MCSAVFFTFIAVIKKTPYEGKLQKEVYLNFRVPKGQESIIVMVSKYGSWQVWLPEQQAERSHLKAHLR